jgi:HK97 family phage major capsid protein
MTAKISISGLKDLARKGNAPAMRVARDRLQKDLDAVVAGPKAENRNLYASEARKFEALSTKLAKADKIIGDHQKRIDSAHAAQAARAPGWSPGRTEARGGIAGIYQGTDDRGRQLSMVRDMAARACHMYGGYAFDIDNLFDDRLTRALQMQSAYETQLAEQETRALNRAMDSILEDQERRDAGFEQRVNPNTSSGTGGEFVPPAWLISQYVPFFRPGRVTADLCTNKPLPPGTDVINIPRITTGSTTAIQPAQGTAVSSTDIVTTAVKGPVNTISGQEDISLQLLEQSPIAMDGVVFQDLSADLAQRIDLQVLAGTGINGQLTGILNNSPNGITYTSGSPTWPLLHPFITQGMSQIINNRFMSAEAILMHSRRWIWGLGQLDSNTNRPLIIPTEQGAFQASGRLDQSTDLSAPVGRAMALPVYVDPNVPTTMNGTATTGGTQDTVIVGKFSDSWLFESAPRLRALPEILSGTLQIRFQVYEYVAVCHRLAASYSAITGTGLAAPSGY